MPPFILSQLSTEVIESILSDTTRTFELGEEVVDKLRLLEELRRMSHDILSDSHAELVTRLGTPSEWKVEISKVQRELLG